MFQRKVNVFLFSDSQRIDSENSLSSSPLLSCLSFLSHILPFSFIRFFLPSLGSFTLSFTISFFFSLRSPVEICQILMTGKGEKWRDFLSLYSLSLSLILFSFLDSNDSLSTHSLFSASSHSMIFPFFFLQQLCHQSSSSSLLDFLSPSSSFSFLFSLYLTLFFSHLVSLSLTFSLPHSAWLPLNQSLIELSSSSELIYNEYIQYLVVNNVMKSKHPLSVCLSLPLSLSLLSVSSLSLSLLSVCLFLPDFLY